MNDLEEKVLQAYQDGSDLGYIVESLNIPYKRVKEILVSYKNSNRLKRTFTDEFKTMIAERDINGVARSTIATELDISVSTVQKACVTFGQAIKDKSISDNAYTKVKGSLQDGECPSCKSKKLNTVDDNAVYCTSCGNEYVEKEDGLYKIEWHYID